MNFAKKMFSVAALNKVNLTPSRVRIQKSLENAFGFNSTPLGVILTSFFLLTYKSFSYETRDFRELKIEIFHHFTTPNIILLKIPRKMNFLQLGRKCVKARE